MANTKKTQADVDLMESPAVKAVEKTSEPLPRTFSPDDYISVKNNVMGPLVYNSTKNDGTSVSWSHFGDEELMRYSELQTMRNTQRRFFEEQWVYIEDAEILKALGVDQFYKDALTSSDFDSLFRMSSAEIERRISIMSPSMKENVRIRATKLVKEGKLDSLKKIRTLNKALGCDLFSEQ